MNKESYLITAQKQKDEAKALFEDKHYHFAISKYFIVVQTALKESRRVQKDFVMRSIDGYLRDEVKKELKEIELVAR